MKRGRSPTPRVGQILEQISGLTGEERERLFERLPEVFENVIVSAADSFALYYLKNRSAVAATHEELEDARELWKWLWQHARAASTNSRTVCVWVYGGVLSTRDYYQSDEAKMNDELNILRTRSPESTVFENPLENDFNAEKFLSFADLCALSDPYSELERQKWNDTEKWDTKIDQRRSFLANNK